jgi:NADPH:quinone reductase-like Zn-dependent oxidoreductase
MRRLAVCGIDYEKKSDRRDRFATVEIAGVPLRFGLVHGPDTGFDAGAAASRDQVLIRTRAFSLNFRDKALMLGAAQRLAPDACEAFGSEFVGEVVACGPGVDRFRAGDRVMTNPAYPSSGVPGLMPGLPTNAGSTELQAFHQAKLIGVPEAMTDEVAAAFPIGAQTSYSMIRRLKLRPGQSVLVTAARSNTSLFAIQALRREPVDVYALTTSDRHRAEIEALGVKGLFRIDPDIEELSQDPGVLAAARACQGFNAVIDPYSDLFLPRSLDVLAFFARYTTCGIFNQYLDLTGGSFRYRGKAGTQLMINMLVKDVSVIWNCLGHTQDLVRAIADHEAGALPVILDSVHTGEAFDRFLERTYNAPDRFGKVVFRYA